MSDVPYGVRQAMSRFLSDEAIDEAVLHVRHVSEEG